jgi:hypothetical protein
MCDISKHEKYRDHMCICVGFKHRTSQLARNVLNFLSHPPHVVSRHLDKFHDLWTSFAFYRILKQIVCKLVAMFQEEDV